MARDKAFDKDADIRFRIKHAVPVFEKTFADVAHEYNEFHKGLAASGQITLTRLQIVDCYIRLHLIPYVGNIATPRKDIDLIKQRLAAAERDYKGKLI